MRMTTKSKMLLRRLFSPHPVFELLLLALNKRLTVKYCSRLLHCAQLDSKLSKLIDLQLMDI